MYARLVVATMSLGLAFGVAACGSSDGGESISQIAHAVKPVHKENEPAWHNGQVVCIHFAQRTVDKGNGRYYLTSPQDEAQDPDFQTDCVTRLPGDRGFNAGNSLVGVFPGPNANGSNTTQKFNPVFGAPMVSHADLGGGLVALDHADRIDAAEALGLVAIVPFGFEFTIHQVPMSECPAHHEEGGE